MAQQDRCKTEDIQNEIQSGVAYLEGGICSSVLFSSQLTREGESRGKLSSTITTVCKGYIREVRKHGGLMLEPFCSLMIYPSLMVKVLIQKTLKCGPDFSKKCESFLIRRGTTRKLFIFSISLLINNYCFSQPN